MRRRLKQPICSTSNALTRRTSLRISFLLHASRLARIRCCTAPERNLGIVDGAQFHLMARAAALCWLRRHVLATIILTLLYSVQSSTTTTQVNNLALQLCIANP